MNSTKNNHVNYRAFLADKRMVYICSDTGLWLYEGGWSVIDHFPGKNEVIGAHDDGTILMRSTGLKDKNGTVIYEGDIVKSLLFNGDELISIIMWDDKNAKFYAGDKFGEFNHSAGLFKHFVVIGNKYEKSLESQV